MACERHIGAPERESARHKEPELIIIIINPGGCGQAEQKRAGEKKQRALWAGDAVGCMEEGWAKNI